MFQLQKTIQTIEDYQRLSKTIKDHRRPSKTIEEYQRISKTIEEYQRILKTIRDYRRISKNIKEYRRLSKKSLRIVSKESWLSKIIPWYEMTHFLIHSFSQTWKLDRESFLAASRVVEERLPFLITFFWLGLLVGYHSFLRDCFMMVAIFHLSFIILFASCLADQMLGATTGIEQVARSWSNVAINNMLVSQSWHIFWWGLPATQANEDLKKNISTYLPLQQKQTILSIF